MRYRKRFSISSSAKQIGNDVREHVSGISVTPVENVRLGGKTDAMGLLRQGGPVIAYSLMQAVGITNDHLLDCRYR